MSCRVCGSQWENTRGRSSTMTKLLRNVTPDRKTTLVTGVCPILGKILICTTDKHGNSVGLPVSPAELKALIKFTGAYSREALQHVKRVKPDDSE
jgi:hypothetical protein